jgi:hypothetical protein
MTQQNSEQPESFHLGSSIGTAESLGCAHLQILQHSIGADKHGRIVRGGGRNHFVTGDGSRDHPLCMALVAAGLMTRRSGSAISGGDDIFHVTDEGKRYVAEQSPPPPKLTRSQRRYQEFLDSDSGYSFGDWLRASA